MWKREKPKKGKKEVTCYGIERRHSRDKTSVKSSIRKKKGKKVQYHLLLKKGRFLTKRVTMSPL